MTSGGTPHALESSHPKEKHHRSSCFLSSSTLTLSDLGRQHGEVGLRLHEIRVDAGASGRASHLRCPYPEIWTRLASMSRNRATFVLFPEINPPCLTAPSRYHVHQNDVDGSWVSNSLQNNLIGFSAMLRIGCSCPYTRTSFASSLCRLGEVLVDTTLPRDTCAVLVLKNCNRRS